MEIGKIPPHDIEAEQAILGCMLTDKDAVISAIEVLKEESFYREDNRAIYSAILSLYSRNEPVDIITVKAELVEQGNFERVGGLEYLAELPERVPTTANVEKYIKIVDEKATLRSLIQTSNELIALEKQIGAWRDKNDIVFISHGDSLEDAQFVAELIKKRLGIENFLINHIGPTIGAHSGPGTIALFYMGDYR